MQLEANITFPHHRLDVYRLSLEVLDSTAALVKRVPRGYGYACNQLSRAALSTVLAIAEGASRQTTRDKRHRYEIGRAECSEAAAVVEALAVLELVPAEEATRLMNLQARVAAMLTRLIRRYGG